MKTVTPNALALVLHHHLPAVAHAELGHDAEGQWPLRYVLGTALPFLDATARLIADEIPFHFSAVFTPTLLWQLAEPALMEVFRPWLGAIRGQVVADLSACKDRDLIPVYEWQLAHLDQLKQRFEALEGTLLDAFADLHRRGHMEVLATAATHGILPLTGAQAAMVRLQVRVGIEAVEAAFGTRPTGLWLPEGAITANLPADVAPLGITHALVEREALHGSTVPVRFQRGGHQITCLSRDPGFGLIPRPEASTFPADYGFRLDEPWGPAVPRAMALGYARPQDEHASDLPLWAVGKDGIVKPPYDPERARLAAEAHAQALVEQYAAQGRPSIGAWPAEMFGDRWVEGPIFFESLCRQIAASTAVAMVPVATLAPASEAASVASTPTLFTRSPEGDLTWWCSPSNDWILPRLHDLAERHLALVAQAGKGGEIEPPHLHGVLAQAAREWMLAAASDWPALMSAGRWVERAVARARDHLWACEQLCECAQALLDEQPMTPEQEGLFAHRAACWSLWPDLTLEAPMRAPEIAAPQPVGPLSLEEKLQLKPGQII